MFFSKPGEYKPCGVFTIGHFILLATTLVIVATALYKTKNSNKEKIKKIIRGTVTVLWILEAIKIAFNFAIGNKSKPNSYIPLYYCSIILYAGILSGWCKGELKRTGDVFLAVGAPVGGGLFLLYPDTSLPTYPMFHYISLQSFIFHGTMLYLGLLVNITNYVDIKHKDIKYYATLMIIISALAYIANKNLDTNFMFISKNFPHTPVAIIYKLTGRFFTLFMVILQIAGPFYGVYYLRKLVKIKKAKKIKLLNANQREVVK